MSSLRQLISEIHRRSLWQVLAIYVVGGWICYSVIQGLTEGLDLPSWFPALALVLFIAGLPVVLATAFLQEGFQSRSQRDPTLIPGTEIGVGGVTGTQSSETSAWRDLFTWRNAMLGAVAAFCIGLGGVILLVLGDLSRAGSLAAFWEMASS